MKEILSYLKDWIIKKLEHNNTTSKLEKNTSGYYILAGVEDKEFKISYEDKRTNRSSIVFMVYNCISDAINYGSDKYCNEQKLSKLMD